MAGAFSLRQRDRRLPQPYEDADRDCEKKKNFEGNSERRTINKLIDRCARRRGVFILVSGVASSRRHDARLDRRPDHRRRRLCLGSVTDATFLDPDNRVAGEQWERQLQRLVLGRVDRRLASTAIPLSRGPWFSWRPVACETQVAANVRIWPLTQPYTQRQAQCDRFVACFC